MSLLRIRNASPFTEPWLHRVWLACGIGLLYFALARLGVSLAYHNQDASLVWPSAGVAVAGILLVGYRATPFIFGAALLSGLWSGAPLLSAVVIAAGNTLGPALGASLLRIGDFRASLERARDVVLLMLVGGFPAALISATVGVACLSLRGMYAEGTELTYWLVWTVGDIAGVVIAAPLLLTWSIRPFWAGDRARMAEFAILLSTAVVACAVAFLVTGPRTLSYPLAYVVFPFATWAALRFEQHGAVTLATLMITIAVWRTLEGNGPFSSVSVQATLMHLHAFVVVVGASSLVLASVTSERRRLVSQQQETLRSEREARLDAQKAVAAREKMVAVVSHEVRNPLATALLNSTLVLESAPREGVPDWVREALETVVLATEQIDHVIRDLTDMTRLEAGQLSLERTPHPVNELVQRVVQMFSPLVEAKGLRMETTLADDLPPVVANRERVLQVFSNVIGNAIRLTPPGGYIRIAGSLAGPSVLFSIADSGPGVSPSLARDLSAPYWESPLRVDQSQGLGIPIARAIISAHGGHFRIRNRPEGGAQVEFTLPCARQPARQLDERAPASRIVSSEAAAPARARA